MTMRRDEQSAAVALVERGVLTQRAGRAMDYFSRHGVFCEAIQSSNRQGGSESVNEIGIVLLDHWYTPAAFNALMEGRYAPTDGDVALALSALAEPEPPEPDGGDAVDADEPTQEQAPDAVVQRLRDAYQDSDTSASTASDTASDTANYVRPGAEAEMEALYQATSQRTDGEGAIGWGLLALMTALIVAGAAFAAYALWAVAHGVWGR